MTDPKFCFDPWVIREFDNDDMGHGHWDFSDLFDLLFKSEDFGSADHIEVKEIHEDDHAD